MPCVLGFTIQHTTEARPQTSDGINFKDKCESCPAGIKCVPHIQCAVHMYAAKNLQPPLCELSSGGHGLCCIEPERNMSSFRTKHHGAHTIKKIQAVVQDARKKFSDMIKVENEIPYVLHHGAPEFTHNMVFRSPHNFDDMKMIGISYLAIEETLATQLYREQENISKNDFLLGHVDTTFDGTVFGHTCGVHVQCYNPQSKYRSEDGTCNNILAENALWGSSGYPMQRLLPPAYEDGIWAPRMTSVMGVPLKSPRYVSRNIFTDIETPHKSLNLLFMQFGQFISHDIVQSTNIKQTNGQGITCCTEDGGSILPPNMLHFACLPITIDDSDLFYNRFNQRCMNFIRSSISPPDQCRMSYAKQISKVTHFIDGSMIYGSDAKTVADVRLFRFGRLQMFFDFDRYLLPITKEDNACEQLDRTGSCYFAGDGRVNQIVSLTAMHTIFAREHNRTAHVLGQLNTHWSDEIVFLETRRIMIAVLQIVLYKEFLPLLIGSEAMDKFNLRLQTRGYTSDYDPHVNPSITNEFSVAAFRMGHSLVDGKFHINHGPNLNEVIMLPETFFKPSRLRQHDFLDKLIHTLLNQPLQRADVSVTPGLMGYLFRNNLPFGLDLAAINIQRGRDHAIRSYNDYLELRGMSRVNHFSEFGAYGKPLSEVYDHVDDIDLWVGGLLEQPYKDALLGPTFIDIIGEQFSRLRRGDRYFHEHEPATNPGHFTLPQLNELRRVTLARIICDNTDQYFEDEISIAAFKLSDQKVSCASDKILQINFAPWKE